MALVRAALRRSLQCTRLPAVVGIRGLQTDVPKKRESLLLKQEPQAELATFADVLKFINEVKDVMNETNPFFAILQDKSLPSRTRMSFVPYMANYSMNFADFVTTELKYCDVDESQLGLIEKEVNAFVDEDNFHYNYYVHDLTALGYTIDKFGDIECLMRYIWSERSLGARRVFNACNKALGFSDDPYMRIAVVEILEAGLQALFTNVYAKVYKAGGDLPELEYWGDTHVNLEANHTVTAQFSGAETIEGEKNEWKHEELPAGVGAACKRATLEIMDRYDDMYRAFYRTIVDTHEGRHSITPKQFKVEGNPPMPSRFNY